MSFIVSVLFYLFQFTRHCLYGVANKLSFTAPARNSIKYQFIRYNATLVIDSPYNGPPSHEVDQAWSNLLESMFRPFGAKLLLT